MTESLFRYGAADNVSLSIGELAKLAEHFGGEEEAAKKIDYFSNQKAAHGYKYKSDYRAILVWFPEAVSSVHGDYSRFVKGVGK